MRIVDLREAPALLPMIAERIWSAFWVGEKERATLETAFVTHLGAAPMPFTLAALDGGRFLGTVSLIAHDTETWAELTPWIAALWVEPAERRAGIGAALVETAAARGFALGYARLHLAATDRNRPYYLRRGWRLHAEITDFAVLTRDAPAPMANA